jgi:transposase
MSRECVRPYVKA